MGTPGALVPPVALLRQLQRVLQSTGALQDVGVGRVAVALAGYLDATEAVPIVHVGLTLPLKRKGMNLFLYQRCHLACKN